MFDVQAAADDIYQAEVKRVPIPSLSGRYLDLALPRAHEVQQLNVARHLKEGARLVGYKIGLTNREAQRHFNVYNPDFGHLYNTMAVDHEGEIDINRLIQPKIEGEVAFVLKKDLRGPGLTLVDALSAIDYATVALEILDCRFENWKLSHAELVADNGASSRFVLAPVRHLVGKTDLGSLGLAVSRNGQVWSTGAGSAVMGNPISALVFLANELGKRDRHLAAGELILSGAVSGMLRVDPGDSFVCEMAELGTVSVRFSKRNV